jgi:antitoxin HicB
MIKEHSLIYGAKITRENEGYIITFRDLKNVFTEADTRKEAIIRAHEVLDLLLTEMIQDGLSIPKPSHLRKGEIPIFTKINNH